MRVYVIIPVFNVEKYLKTCLDSIFSQTCLETIDVIPVCINDGSTDSSLLILDEYKKKHPELVILNKINGGLSSARNAGLDYIKDDQNSYFTFLDSDDFLKPDYIEKLVTIAEDRNADIVCTTHINIEENGPIIDCEYDYSVIEYSRFESIIALFGNDIYSHGPCKLYKVFTWDNIRYDENVSFMEDQRTEFKVFLNSRKVIKYDYRGYYYLHRVGSLCQSKMSNKKIIDAMNSYIYTYNYDYQTFNSEQINEIKELIKQQIATIYLMMVGRFSKKTALNAELQKWHEIKRFVKTNKIIRNFKPKNKKERIKKMTYVLLPFLYKPLFSLFLKKYDRA